MDSIPHTTEKPTFTTFLTTKIMHPRLSQFFTIYHWLKIIPQRQRAIDPKELALHLGIAVTDNRDVILKIKYQLAAHIETIQRRLASV